jgi:hypothetical protein
MFTINKSESKNKENSEPDKEIIFNYDCLEPNCRLTELGNSKSDELQKSMKTKGEN